jgi:phosphoribosylanthranilate isomerase
MKNTIVLFLLITFLAFGVSAQTETQRPFNEWKIVTVVESLVGMGAGRSRMIENMTEVQTEQFRTTRTDGKTSSQREVSRSELKVEKFDEAKLLNFFSAGGINFQNIASNDAMIAARIMELESEGYSLIFVSSAVESNAGANDGNGLFITRMYFKRTLVE